MERKIVPQEMRGVVGVDRVDELDRQKLSPVIKFQLLCAEVKERFGRDPRSGGFVFVARPRAMLQLLIDIRAADISAIKLERPVIAGSRGGDVVGWWSGVPVVVRSTTVDDNLWCVREDDLPPSLMVDRARAGELRLAAHHGRLDSLKEN